MRVEICFKKETDLNEGKKVRSGMSRGKEKKKLLIVG